jgi:hypothetical protein
MTYTFDWQKEPENFLKWMVPHLLAGLKDDDETFDKIYDATDGFENVTLTIQINGVDIPVKHFVDSIAMNMDVQVELAARQMIKDIPKLKKLKNLMDLFEVEMLNRMQQIARENNLDLHED